MQHLDSAAVTGDQYAVLQFKGLYAGMQDTVWWRGQSGAGLRGQTCLVVTAPVHSWPQCPEGDIRPEAILSRAFATSRTAQ